VVVCKNDGGTHEMKGIMLNRKIWIVGLLLVAFSLVSLAESLRLIFYKDPRIIFDVLGPGYYLLLLSIGLLVTAVVYIYQHLRKRESVAKEKTSKEMRIRLMGSIVVCVLYLILINTIGYGVASFVFFMLEFRIVGIKSWPFNFALSVMITAAYYVIFVMYCDMVFPRGLLF